MPSAAGSRLQLLCNHKQSLHDSVLIMGLSALHDHWRQRKRAFRALVL